MDNIEQRQPKSNRFGMFIIVFLLLLSLIGNGIMGYNVIFSQSKVGTICGDKYIDSINSIIKSNNINHSTVKEMYSDVKSIDRNNIDPNCQAILFISSFMSGSLNDSRKAYNNLTELGKKGQNPSLKINFLMSYNSLKEKMETNLDNKVKVER